MAEKYSAYKDRVAYRAKKSGAAVEVIIKEVGTADEADGIVGGVTSFQWSDTFEVNRDEQVGKKGAEELFEGQYSGSLSIGGFFTPAANDRAPTKGTFLGRSFTVFERAGEGRPGEGVVHNAFVGAKCTAYTSNHAARGPKTVNMSFEYIARLNGQEWADLTGMAA